jgi:hypothetical protein
MASPFAIPPKWPDAPEPALDRRGVMTLVGEGVAAAQHVRVRLELKAGDRRGALDHAGEAGRGEG